MTSAQPCRICGNAENNRSHVAREMWTGTREEFRYVECGGCGCLQIAEIPADLARHYADAYYSLENKAPARNGLKVRARRARAGNLFGQPSLGGWLAAGLVGRQLHWRWLELAGASFDSRILDAGSGAGALLRKLEAEGFRHLTGIDPYIREPIERGPGFRILKGEVGSLGECFDLVMLNHSLEHIPDQAGTMSVLRRLVAPGGTLLIRIPLCGTYAWRTYGVDWVQLDAPRHLYLHTERSMRLLAERAGFDVRTVEYDSTAFQLWGSEQYRNDIPLRDPRSLDGRRARFSPRLRRYRARARALNAAGDGDQACFYLVSR